MNRYIPLLLALASCATPPPATTTAPPIDAAPSIGMPSPPAPPAHLSAAAAFLDGPTGTTTPQHARYGPIGRYRVLHSPCRMDGASGRPVALPDRRSPPTVGRTTRVQWSTELLAPPMPAAAYVLVSFGHRPPIDLTAAGFPGCLMHVDPAPSNLWAIGPGPGSIVTVQGGRLWLDWTPAPEFAGHEIRAQPLFALRGRWIWGPAVELWVGAGQ